MKSKFAEEQSSFALKQAEYRTPVPDIIRKMGITEQTFYRWGKKYIGLETNEPQRLSRYTMSNRMKSFIPKG